MRLGGVDVKSEVEIVVVLLYFVDIYNSGNAFFRSPLLENLYCLVDAIWFQSVLVVEIPVEFFTPRIDEQYLILTFFGLLLIQETYAGSSPVDMSGTASIKMKIRICPKEGLNPGIKAYECCKSLLKQETNWPRRRRIERFWHNEFPYLNRFRKISEIPVFHKLESRYCKVFGKVNRGLYGTIPETTQSGFYDLTQNQSVRNR